MTLLEQAREYRKQGFSIIPIGDDKKCPISWKEYQNRIATDIELGLWFHDSKMMQSYPKLAIVTGKISNIIVVDFDTKEDSDYKKDCADAPVVFTPRGCHYYFQYEDGITNKAGIIEKLDIRGEGGYVLAPPSKGYEWIVLPTGQLPKLPESIRQLLKQDARVSPTGLEEVIKSGSRNATLASLAGTMRNRGFSYEGILKALEEENKLRCKPPLSILEVEAIANSISRYEPKNQGGSRLMQNQQSPKLQNLGSIPSSPATLVKYSSIKDVDYPPIEVIKTTIPCLDRYLDGGLGLQEMSLIIAEPEVGKTTLGCYVAAQAMNQGYDVLHVFFEDQQKDIKDRYDHNVSTEYMGESYFLDAGSGRVTLSTIEEKIKECNPGLVVIDYLARIPSIKGNNTESRFDIKDILTTAVTLAKTYNCHVMVLDHVTVVNKQGTPNYRMDVSRLAEAKQFKWMITTIMIGIMVDMDDSSRLYFTGMKTKRKKGRDSQSLFNLVMVDRETGEFYEE